MKIGSVAGGAGASTTFQLAYCPEKIRFITATLPQAVKVNVLGVGVITDLDANGVLSFGRRRKISIPTNGYEIPLSDGLIMNKNVEITITNGGASAFDLYVDSNNVGGLGYVQCLRQTVFASTVFEASKFAMLGLGNVANGDLIDVTFADGTVQKVEPAEIGFMVANYQTDSQTVKVIDNIDNEVKSVRFIPANNEVVYLMTYLFTDLAKQFVVTR